ncbi:MAG: ABC transporter permease [Bacilli bacterium]|nr:ABC transporter permease [Bacilli bacterium]
MFFRDRLSFSLHTIKENKSRSILTVIISMFLSLLIMGLMSISISFIKNSEAVIRDYYFKENGFISTIYNNPIDPIAAGQGAKQEVLNNEKYKTFIETIDKHQEVVSNITYNVNLSGLSFTDPHYPISHGITFVEGRNIVPSLAGNEVIVSQRYYADSLRYGEDYSVGTTHVFNVTYWTVTKSGTMHYEAAKVNGIVVGIFSPSEETYYDNGEKTQLLSQSAIFIADINAALNINKNVFAQSATISYINSSKNVNVDSIFSKTESLGDDLDKSMPKKAVAIKVNQREYVVEYEKAVNSKPIEDMNKLSQFRLIFIGGGAGIALILLLVSVGSLANSVTISIDRSKKFIGLLKALGIKAKPLKNIIVFESIILISVGIIAAFIILWALYYPLSLITGTLVSSIYGGYLDSMIFVPRLYVPIYVLIATIVLFILFTILFSRGSLRSISKMDPIQVISEVS